MIERQIPKEIGDKEISSVGKFSLRQFAFICAGIAVVAIAFFIIPDTISLDYRIVISGIFAIPFIICVFFKRYKMYAYTYFYKLIFNITKNAKFRCYKRYNQYEKLERIYDSKHKEKPKKHKSKVKYKVVKIK